jgi:nitrile hydratase accessory protein
VSAVERPDAQIGLMDGAAALPRKNGELVFAAPWEGRAFGLAVALSDERCYGWDDFRARLVDEIGRGPDAPYYESWLAALERVLVERGLVTPEELERRTAEYASGEREDHDHDHDHDHHHDHGEHHHHH